MAGNPAQIRGYVDSAGPEGPHGLRATGRVDAGARQVRGASVVALRCASDARGTLAVAEVGSQLPFLPRRIFFVYDVPSREVRGEHAHRLQEQLLVCVRGSCSVMIDDGDTREELRLDSPERAVHLGPLVWAVQYRFTPDAVLTVAASGEYDPDEYVRDYEEFLTLVQSRHA